MSNLVCLAVIATALVVHQITLQKREGCTERTISVYAKVKELLLTNTCFNGQFPPTAPSTK